jgi:dienelactone hydrolase
MTRLLLALLLVVAAPAVASPTVEDIGFESQGATLAGSIVLPTGDIRAGIVFIHGSGPQERSLHWAHEFAKAGIAALVYDKRGAGKSGGTYEGNLNVSAQNLELLATDAASALRRLSTHAALAGKPLGFAGISQAGWIAPLAAKRTTLAKFLVLWSGPVCKVSEEDLFSKFTADTDGPIAPPYSDALAARKTPYVWPVASHGQDTDPSTSLATLAIPGLWIFSDNDSSVPVDLSIARLQTLRQRGKPYDYVLFSGLGHNNMNGTFAVATDWIRQRK